MARRRQYLDKTLFDNVVCPRRTVEVGKVFGRWTVESRTLCPDGKKSERHAYWLCLCACGTKRTVLAMNLLNGSSQSCGCLQQDARAWLERPDENKYEGFSIVRRFMKELPCGAFRRYAEIKLHCCGKLQTATWERILKKKRRLGCLSCRGKARARYKPGDVVGVYKVVSKPTFDGVASRYQVKCVKCDRETVVNSSSLGRHRRKTIGCKICCYKFRKASKYADDIQRLYAEWQRSCSDRFIEVTLTFDEWKGLTFSDCHYCGQPPSNFKRIVRAVIESRIFHYGGIDRMDNDRGYHRDNVVPCCIKCNRLKGKRHYSEFVSHTRKMAKHQGLVESAS